MENFAFVASVSLVVISAVVVAVGIYLILLMVELRKILRTFNSSLSLAGTNLAQLVAALQHIGSYTLSFQAGVKTLESLIQWLKDRSKTESKRSKKS